MRRAAIRSAASVLYVPAIAHTQHGTIVAVVRGPEDRAVLDQAAALAARSGERLLVLSAAAGGNGLDIAGICAAHGVADNRVEVRAMRDASPRALGEELRRVPQSLIILARGVLGLDDEKALLQLAAVLRTPVLALESSSPNAVAGDTTDG
jgi:hypothetical protein